MLLFYRNECKQIDSDARSAGKPALRDAVPQVLAVSFATSLWW